MKTLIAVTTCHRPEYAPRAQAQRETWVPDAAGFADVMFFYGPPLDTWPFVNSDEVALFDTDDSYLGRPSKIRSMCRWALREGYDRVLKTDDDTYINMDVLRNVEYQADYVGRPVETRDRTTGKTARFASGFAYWLSAKAMNVIANALDLTGLEDRWVGETLFSADIPLLADPKLYVAAYPGIAPQFTFRHRETRDGAVFCEYKQPAKMFEMHACRNAKRNTRRTI